MDVLCIAGARPNFMKVAPVLDALAVAGLEAVLAHTGQHYDRSMSEAFFEDLGIPRPAYNLEVGSGTHPWQIAEVMRRLEPVLCALRPQVVLVVGDVNSTLAATLTAVTMGIPVAHVEAGLRSFDRAMPEEINRILTDSVAQWLFVSEPAGVRNLLREGIDRRRIFEVGNVMIDTLHRQLPRARALGVPESLDLVRGRYALLTLHRPVNVDDPARLASILAAVGEIAEAMPVLFIVHPRTRGRLTESGLAASPAFERCRVLEPVGYLAMLGLMDAAALVLTDSGGIQEETTVLGVPCLTIRENTERPITIEIGSNRLVGHETAEIVAAARQALADPPAGWQIPPLWDGCAAERIAAVLKRELALPVAAGRIDTKRKPMGSRPAA